MTRQPPKCLICDCEGSMPLDRAALERAAVGTTGGTFTQLCRAELPDFEAALRTGEPLLVGCTQEEPLFQEVAGEAGHEARVAFVNLREAAGWSDEAGAAGPKMAAILAGARTSVVPARLKTIRSDGHCLVYGAGQQAWETAALLSARLSVTLLLSDPGDLMLPRRADLPVFRGRITRISGGFGSFSVKVDGHAPLDPASRDAPRFGPPKDGAETICALILDLSGGTPLVAGTAHRDGYVAADPGDPAAVLRAAFSLADMVGEFEKPIYVGYDRATCAHARSGITGCSKCLDACPAGAITADGDGVSVDPVICGGCGACAAVCPTGAISYLYPGRGDGIRRLQRMAATFRAAGGRDPVLLLHDGGHGADLIGAMARHGRGLPARVVPLELHAPTSTGHIEMAAALSAGFARVLLLTDPRRAAELAPLAAEASLCEAILTGLGLENGRIDILSGSDPDIVEDRLWALEPAEAPAAPAFDPVGSRREVARAAFLALADGVAPEGPIALPQHAPYGRVEIDTAACTLCMSCVSACPTGAMMDTPDEPTLRFTEAACVQCGLCVATCPERALALVPRLNLSPSAMRPETLKHEEPFACISCGKPFATRSAIERVAARLAGHSMYASPERKRLIEMCEDCRVIAQAEAGGDPFAYGTPRRVRTTEDDLAERALTPQDFLIDD